MPGLTIWCGWRSNGPQGSKMIRRHFIALICSRTVLCRAGILVGLWIWDWQEVDSCLDDRRRWDYKYKACGLK